MLHYGQSWYVNQTRVCCSSKKKNIELMSANVLVSLLADLDFGSNCSSKLSWALIQDRAVIFSPTNNILLLGALDGISYREVNEKSLTSLAVPALNVCGIRAGHPGMLHISCVSRDSRFGWAEGCPRGLFCWALSQAWPFGLMERTDPLHYSLNEKPSSGNGLRVWVCRQEEFQSFFSHSGLWGWSRELPLLSWKDHKVDVPPSWSTNTEELGASPGPPTWRYPQI